MWSLIYIHLIHWFILMQACSSCKKRPATVPTQNRRNSLTCNDTLADNCLPRFFKEQQSHFCHNSDFCLRIEIAGKVTDYARLYYDKNPYAYPVILHGYLVNGNNGVSITGKTSTFKEYYVTLISPKSQKNDRFFVNEFGETSVISLQNVSYPVYDDHEQQNKES